MNARIKIKAIELKITLQQAAGNALAIAVQEIPVIEIRSRFFDVRYRPACMCYPLTHHGFR